MSPSRIVDVFPHKGMPLEIWSLQLRVCQQGERSLSWKTNSKSPVSGCSTLAQTSLKLQAHLWWSSVTGLQVCWRDGRGLALSGPLMVAGVLFSARPPCSELCSFLCSTFFLSLICDMVGSALVSAYGPLSHKTSLMRIFVNTTRTLCGGATL